MADRRPISPADAASGARQHTDARSDAASATAPDTLTFADLGVPSTVSRALLDEGIDVPFPIQAATLPDTIAGRDVLGRGKTGSGKTLAFAIPVVTRLAVDSKKRTAGRPRALILAPTRELVNQIYQTVDMIGRPCGLRTTTVYGGVSAKPQIDAFRKGVDIVVACPGRLEDLIGQRALSLEGVEITVLDEADHMADLGFLPAVKRLLDRTPYESQRLLFSATLDRGIDGLVKRYLNSPVTHEVDPEESPVDLMEHHVLHVTADHRNEVLIDLLSAPGKTIVFTRTKHRAKSLARALNKNGIPSVDMHGNLAQNARMRNLAAFSDGRATTLVATDIAARGIHVDDVSLVIHADPPVEHKAYLHRSGRTARAGSAGTVVTLATPDQRRDVADLARKAKIKPTITEADPRHPILIELAPGDRVRLTQDDISRRLPVNDPSAQGAGTNRAGGGGGGGRGRARGPKAGGAKAGSAKPQGAKSAAAKPSGPKNGRPNPTGPKAAGGPSSGGQPAGTKPGGHRGQRAGAAAKPARTKSRSQSGAAPAGQRAGTSAGPRSGGQRSGAPSGQRAGAPSGQRAGAPSGQRAGAPSGQRRRPRP